MRKTRIVVALALLALFVASAASVAAALTCHGPFYTNWGNWDGLPDGSQGVCSGYSYTQCQAEEEVVFVKLIVNGTFCRVKYNCYKDPV